MLGALQYVCIVHGKYELYNTAYFVRKEELTPGASRKAKTFLVSAFSQPLPDQLVDVMCHIARPFQLTKALILKWNHFGTPMGLRIRQKTASLKTSTSKATLRTPTKRLHSY